MGVVKVEVSVLSCSVIGLSVRSFGFCYDAQVGTIVCFGRSTAQAHHDVSACVCFCTDLDIR